MAKMDFRKIRNEYIRRSMRYANGVSMLYDQALSDIAREFALVDYNPDIVFSFSNYGKFGRVDGIMSRLEEQIQSVINVGIENEFGKAYEAHNELLKQVLGDNITTELERAFAPRLTSGNAAKLYISETASNNITRSMRVWNGATLGQMETAVQEAMMEGMPAQQMAGLIEQYLNDPESCFRRFRIKTGVDADGKSMYGRKWMKRVRNEDGSTSWFDADPRDYPTGQGVYHSSYKNALRYTRTTTNIAYRTADYERYQTEDFVLGIEIHTTSNPTHKEDICDFLAGRYPKDFKWVGWHVNCYSDDTEVYTKDGWKLFKDVKDDDLILSLNPQTRDLEYVPILLNISRPHKGKMVHFFNRSYSQLVTPEHDVLCVSKQDGRTFRRLKAEKCGVTQPIYRSSEWRGKKIESVAVGSLNVPFNLFAEFMGYYLSDGSLGHKWEINIAQTDDDRSRIYDCMAKMGMKPRYNGGLVSFNNQDWYEYLQQFGKAASKYVPQEIKESNADGIKVFLNAFVSCDGYTKKPHAFVGSHGTVCQSKEDERIYFTSSKRMADDIGELILKIGRRPSFKVVKCAGKQQEFRNGTYTINNDNIIITECRSQYATQYNKEYVDYDGMVYDITLAKNNTLYIRHNGKCFWGSNCMCYEIPILATPDEVNAMADAIINGQDPSTVPLAGRVTDVPDNFKEWVANNQDRIQDTLDRGKELPYFLRDNKDYMDEALGKDRLLEKIQTEFDVYRPSRFRDTSAPQFDLIGLKEQIKELGGQFDFDVDNCRLSFDSHGGWSFIIESAKKEYSEDFGGMLPSFSLKRDFRLNDKGDIIVTHNHFNLADRLQDNGIAKQILAKTYESYKNMGVRYIQLNANMSVGGYAWARYGFSARDKQTALDAIARMNRVNKNPHFDEAVSFIEKWYRDNSMSAVSPFPMRLLSEQPYGKDILKGTSWDGIFDLLDREQVRIFELYLGLI